jgi:hypothetical protein
VFWNVDFILNILSGYITDADGYSNELLA